MFQIVEYREIFLFNYSQILRKFQKNQNIDQEFFCVPEFWMLLLKFGEEKIRLSTSSLLSMAN
jgi:hypothetical protein